MKALNKYLNNRLNGLCSASFLLLFFLSAPAFSEEDTRGSNASKNVEAASAVAQDVPKKSSQEGDSTEKENDSEGDKKADEEKLASLFDALREQPEDLDLNFSYANLAIKMGKFDEALAAYDRMLIVNPNLDRVKLDMGLLYMRLENYVQARKMFDEVMSRNPPKTVQDNINLMVKRIEDSEKKHRFTFSLTAGINSDGNATSSPSTGEVDLFGASVSLDDSSVGISDDHRYVALSGKHSYALPGAGKHMWQSEALFYKTHQSSLRNIDLTVRSIKTGPTFNIPKIRTKIGFDLAYADTNLAHNDYLKTITKGIRFEYFYSPRVVLSGGWNREWRRFKNAPGVTTYELRNGRADEQKFNVMTMLTQKDVLNVTFKTRQEDTEISYYNNRQIGATVAYTHLFSGDYFTNVSLGIKESQYKGIDVLVNPLYVRQDVERSFSLLVGKKFTPQLTGTISYVWKEVDANIQNYEYANERVSAALSYSFSL